MPNYNTATVIDVHHWNDRLFSFKTARDRSFRFESGQFVMVGLDQQLTRAYSIVSPHYADHLEFLSIVAPDGKLTPKLQQIEPGDKIVHSTKAVGCLTLANLKPGRTLYLLATGTGIAPFISIIQDPQTYQRYEEIVLIHSVRYKDDLVYTQLLKDLCHDAFIGDLVSGQFSYAPLVTRETNGWPKRHIQDLLRDDMFLDNKYDRIMFCGSLPFVQDMKAFLQTRYFVPSQGDGDPQHYVYERAFV